MDTYLPPFRWTVARRERLGSLIDGDEATFQAWLGAELGTLGRISPEFASVDAPLTWLLGELTHVTARAFSHAAEGDLYFVGRSLESLFDFVSGVVADTAWAPRIHLLPFSIRTTAILREALADAAKARAIADHLAAHQLGPDDLLRRDRPVAFVDVVASGDTFGNLIHLLRGSGDRAHRTWRQIRPKIRLIGLTERTKTSPNTWRWQQHAPWARALPRGAIKNIAIPPALLHYLGAAQTKTTLSFHPGHWLDPAVRRPQHTPPVMLALRLALALYDAGRSTGQRELVAREMADLPAMRQRWYRDLLRAIKAQA